MPGATYLWQDGSAGRTYSALTTGKYFVAVTSSTGCTARDTVQLIINTKPTVDFSLSLDPCNPFSVSFANIGTSVLNPYWSFGDGITITGTLNPVHAYPAFGNYVVKFSLQNSNGCTDTIIKSIACKSLPSQILLPHPIQPSVPAVPKNCLHSRRSAIAGRQLPILIIPVLQHQLPPRRKKLPITAMLPFPAAT